MVRSITSSGGGVPRWLWVVALGGLLTLCWACGTPDGDSESAAPDGEAADGGGDQDGEDGDSGEETAAGGQRRAEVPEGPPIDGFQQLMPRGGIPALYDPQFVTAAEAEIPDDAWVLGFEFGGNAYAYDLNTLNHHEVVNHEIGGVPVAAVW